MSGILTGVFTQQQDLSGLPECFAATSTKRRGAVEMDGWVDTTILEIDHRKEHLSVYLCEPAV